MWGKQYERIASVSTAFHVASSTECSTQENDAHPYLRSYFTTYDTILTSNSMKKQEEKVKRSMTNISEQLCTKLRLIVGDDGVEIQPKNLVDTASDATSQHTSVNIVVYPRTTQQVSDLLCFAHERALPVVARGSGTSLTGSNVPIQEELVLSLTRMNHIVEIDPQTSTATVEAGVINGDLQHALEPFGLFYPPDPASLMEGSLGGNVGCNSGRPRCLQCGVTKDYGLGVMVVLAAGRLLAM